MKKHHLATCITAAAFISGLTLSSAFADSARSFLEDAIRGNNSEIKLGQLAQQKAASESVRSFGRTLQTDHSKGNEQAIALAKQMQITPPTDATTEADKEYDKLSKMSGAQFDSEFTSYMVQDHRKDIAEYQEQAKDKSDLKVAQLATETLPTLQHHLELAQSLQKQASR
jgi:putative membrane protein